MRFKANKEERFHKIFCYMSKSIDLVKALNQCLLKVSNCSLGWYTRDFGNYEGFK